jgi:thiamine kinase-like enzyme
MPKKVIIPDELPAFLKRNFKKSKPKKEDDQEILGYLWCKRCKVNETFVKEWENTMQYKCVCRNCGWDYNSE